MFVFRRLGLVGMREEGEGRSIRRRVGRGGVSTFELTARKLNNISQV